MAITTSDFTKYFLENALGGFINAFPSMNSITFVSNPTGAGQGSVVRVPYVSTNTGSADFAYSTGYITDTTTVSSKNVTLDTLKYEKWDVTDTDYQNLTSTVITQIASTLGAKLAATVAADVLSLAGGAFPSASFTGGQFTSSNAGVALMTSASNWSVAGRSLIMTPTLQGYILKDSNVINNAVFGGNVASKGTLTGTQYYGFDPYLANSVATTGVGFVCLPGALLFANSYHQPQPMESLVNGASITDPKTNITLGYRQISLPNQATVRHVIDVLYGKAIGDVNSGIVIRA